MQASDIRIDTERLRHELAAFSGAPTRTRHWSRRLLYTQGIEHFAAQARAWWLIDLIASLQRSRPVADAPFQVWMLTVATDRSATLRCEDGDDGHLKTKRIACTDFPLDAITVWVAGDTLMLPSEY